MKGAVVWGGLLLAGSALAAGAATPPLHVRCESERGLRQHCAIDTDNGVQMVRQLSNASCVRGSDWGIEPDGGAVWVASGCRAEFQSLRLSAGAGVQRRVVRCQSDGPRQSCSVLLRGAPVRLLRQLSAWPCREGRTWGVRRNEIWVSRGCNAEFELGAEDGSGFVAAPRRLSCESKSRLRRVCGTTVERTVRLHRQLSGSACVQGETWGWDRQGVWVDAGCRGEFIVD